MPPQVNVFATAILVIVVCLMFANLAWQRRAARKEGIPVPEAQPLGI